MKILLALLAVVSTTTTSVPYTGNGAAQDYLIPFAYADPTNITVTLADVAQVQGIDYSVVGSSFVENTSNIHFNTAPAVGAAIVITRTTPPLQPTALQAQGKYTPKTHEHAWDRSTFAIQDLGRSVTSISPAGFPPCLAGQHLTNTGSQYLCTYDTGASGTLNSVTFDQLGASANGTELYCTDCIIAATCAGGGTGSVAYRVNGGWTCGAVATAAGSVTLTSAAPFPPTTTQTGNVIVNGRISPSGTQAQGGWIENAVSSMGGLQFRSQLYGLSQNVVSSSSGIYSFFGSQNLTVPMLTMNWALGSTTSTVGRVTLRIGSCSPTAPCIGTSSNAGADTSPLYLAGADANSANNAVYTNTQNFTLASGLLFGVQNHGVTKFSVAWDGASTFTGPISGTSASFTGSVTGGSVTAGATGLTSSGPTTLTGGASIGSGGAAISSSFRATATMVNSTIAAQSCYTQTITVTGAALGAECTTGSLNQAWPNNVTISCFVPAANQCVIQLCNPTAAGINPGNPTIGCRVFNP